MKIWTDFLKNFQENIPNSVECELKMMHSKSALTRFANSQIHQNVDEESADVYLTVHKDGKTLSRSKNITAIKSSKEFIEEALDSLQESPEDTTWAGLTSKTDSHDGYLEKHEPSPDERANLVKDFVNEGKDMNAAGYCSTYINNFFIWNTNGLNSTDTSSSAFIDGIFRTDTSAGSSHRGAVDIKDLDAAQTGNEAASLAIDSQNPVDIDPGKYEVILGHEAVSTILVFLSVYGLNAKSKIDGMSPILINEKQFDEKITLIDTPEDDESIGFKIDASGAKKHNLEVIKNGIPNTFFHTRRTAKELNMKNTYHELFGWGDNFGGIATNLELSKGNTSHEDMISSVKKGIFINEFWYCRVLDPITQVVTGLNRNGSFLIEDGKITKPVGRLRFTQSFITSLSQGNVISVGDTSRYADSEFGEGMLKVPKLHLKEFNFTGGVSG
ncbi:MAG: TldD/PmbA family protein [Planktomarina sp.]|nr:TldD/PmbA family protein [Acidimicrobiaceae bacterium]MDV3050982.1 TldD/PmbA family protein [Planktomarina sp.]|tara:strand:+ start:1153 stop:2478 length:1326 start_codon:yes stop_codon:yes gene_type:complete